MKEEFANKLAELIGGQVFNSGGGVHLVIKVHNYGFVTVYSEDCICEYADEKAFHEGYMSLATIWTQVEPLDTDD